MLKTYYSSNFQIAILKPYIFVDNDCLKFFYDHAILLKELTEDFGLKKLYIYPFTEFEFLRNIPILEIRLLRQKFIENPLFSKISTELHMKFLPKFIENALLLSKIYVQEKYCGESSFIDLVLAGMLMTIKDKGAIITANRKDFPSCVFDTLATINLEFFPDKEKVTQDDHKVIYMLAFNNNRFNECHNRLKEADYKQSNKLIKRISSSSNK